VPDTNAGSARPTLPRTDSLGRWLHPPFREQPPYSQVIWWAVIPVAVIVSSTVRFADPTLAGIKSLSPVMVVWFIAIWHLRGREFRNRLIATLIFSFVAINVPAVLLGESARVSILQYVGAALSGYLIVTLLAALIGTVYLTRTIEMLQVLGFALIGSAIALPFQLLFITPSGGALEVFYWWIRGAPGACITVLTLYPLLRPGKDRSHQQVMKLLLIATLAIIFFLFAMRNPEQQAGWAILIPAVWAAMVMRKWAVAGHALLTLTLVGSLARFPHMNLVQTNWILGPIFIDIMLPAYAITTMGLVSERERRAAMVRELAAREREAKETSALLTSVFDGISDGLLLVDSRGHIERANPVANRLLPEDILARPAQQLASYLIPASEPDYPLAPDDYWTAILNGGTPDFRVTLESPRGDRILSVRTHPLVYESGTKVVVLLQDVTDSVHRLQELTQFADIAAHDLRSPLTALYGLLEIAQDSTDLDEIQMLLARSQASARRMNDEIENWLTHAVARDGELQLQPLDLAPIIEELQHTYPSAKIEDKLTLKPLGDAVLIRQVVVNLVSNAVKYAPKGESPDIVVATAADLEPSMVRIEVRDQGTPLPPSEWVRIFEPYSRGAGAGLQASGTGMGLATCKRIVERHGGQISVTPNRDSAGVPIGNTFVFTLPVA